MLIILSWPVVSLYPQTPVVCNQSVQFPIFWIVSCETAPTDWLRIVKLLPSHLMNEFLVYINSRLSLTVQPVISEVSAIPVGTRIQLAV